MRFTFSRVDCSNLYNNSTLCNKLILGPCLAFVNG